MRKIFLVVLSIVLPLLVLSCFALAYSPLFNKSTDTQFNLKNLTVLQIGSSNGICAKVLSRMQLLGVSKIKHLENASMSMDFNEFSLVIFDGDWISEQVNNPEIHSFFREAPYKGVKLTAIGGSTSKFFEALDKAGVNELGRDENGNVRNPAYSNPPLVGFKLKQASTPDGLQYSYPSMFFSNAENVDAMVQALIDWLGG